MLGFYSTGRLWSQKKLTAMHEEASLETQSRTFAYRVYLDPASSYKHFANWFKRIFLSLRQAQIQKLEKGLPLTADHGLVAPFRAIQRATDALLGPHTGWHTLEYSAEHEELVLTHDRLGKLKASQFSDGIRNMLALVGDIATAATNSMPIGAKKRRSARMASCSSMKWTCICTRVGSRPC